MRLSMMLVVAQAEMRTTRRMFRYWLIAVLSVLIGLLSFGFFTILHGTFSGYSAMAGSYSPRYLMAALGSGLMTLFTLALIFLAFDVRARDERDRMTDVLDAKPLSNAEFLLGKVFGLVFMVWMPILLLALLMEGFGGIAIALDLPVGELIEPVSLIGFLYQSLLSLLVWCSIIVLMVTIVRYRLLVVVLVLALLGLEFWASTNFQIYLQPALTLFPVNNLGSDILPEFSTEGDGPRQLAHWLMAAGFLAVAIALYPRSDGLKVSRTLGTGLGLLILSAICMGWYVYQLNASVAQLDTWRAAHEAKQSLPRPDMQMMTGTLQIRPGDAISMALEIHVQAPQAHSLSTLLFTLNPGLTVERVNVAGVDAEWQHEQGLLEITPPQTLTPGQSSTIVLHASGSPDDAFGYLDSAINIGRADYSRAQLTFLGLKTSIFESGYIAMMPGGHWLPSTGTDVPLGDPRTHPPDYFLLDLEVEIPADWLVAGPGRREALETDGETTSYRFNPSAPIPQPGFVASRFERRSMTVEGIEFEVLFHPGHDRNLHFFANSEEMFRERLTELFSNANNLGLAYPYNGLSLVEIPNILRVYGGGWRLDTAQFMPGMMTMRENSFPTARFERAFRDPKGMEDYEGGIDQARADAVEVFFGNNISGGNLFTGGARNFMLYQTSARGEGALAVNFLLEELTALLLTDRRGYFSAHEYAGNSMLFGDTLGDLGQGNFDSIVATVQATTTRRPSVWNLAIGTPLAELDPRDDPRLMLNVLSLKGHAVARSILDGLGRQQTAQILSELVRQFRGGHFQANDMFRIAAEHDIELEPLLGDWLHDAGLPGFLASEVTSFRLTDDAHGNPRYQTVLQVRNDEPVPGLIAFEYSTGSGEGRVQEDRTDPVRVAANSSVEFGILTTSPINQLALSPYLSLNREDIPLRLPKVDSEQRIDSEPLVGSRESDWRPPVISDIIVDDLDPGFSISGNNQPFAGDEVSVDNAPVDDDQGFKFDVEVKNSTEEAQGEVKITLGSVGGMGGVQLDMDQGLPEHYAAFGFPQFWSRSVYADSWGKYRHTHALIQRGASAQNAVFSARLPHSGAWRLAYYLPLYTVPLKGKKRIRPPQGKLTSSQLGEYQMTLKYNDERLPIEFDGKVAVTGWNDLGEFNLPAGKIELEISTDTTGYVVVADAIRWHPVTEDRVLAVEN